MPRRFFRKFALKRHHVGDRWFLAPFQHLLHDTRLWGTRRRTVVPAFALGLFIAFMPFPGHLAISALLALTFRVNIPVAVVASLVSNPLTMYPMYYAAYRLGQTLLGGESVAFNFELSVDWVTHTFVTIWQPMMLGCLLLGTAAALVGYVALDALWRSSLRDYKDRKRGERNKLG
jgi:uncharacterized protein (DUF2062 family)